MARSKALSKERQGTEAFDLYKDQIPEGVVVLSPQEKGYLGAVIGCAFLLGTLFGGYLLWRVFQ